MSRFAIECVSSYDFLSEDYQTLFDASKATVFQSPHFLNEFYSNLAPALGVEPVIILVRDNASSELLLVMPFVRQKKLAVKMLQPADLGVADYNSMIGQLSDLEEIAADPSFKKEIKKHLGAFDVLFFRKQRPDTFDINSLIADGKRGSNINSAYHVVIGEGVEEWQKTALSKSFKKGLARKLRGLERDFGKVEFKALNERQEIEKAFEFLKNERAKRYEDDLLQNDAYFNFYKELAFKGVKTGDVIVFTGQTNEELLSIEVGFLSQKTVHFILAAFNRNPEYKRHSLGLQSIMQLIQHQNKRGIEVFDFALGDEDYKQFFGAEMTPIENVIFTNSMIGNLACAVYLDNGFLKKLTKKLVPSIS